MPHIRFTDTNLARLGADKTTWFTDPDGNTFAMSGA